MHYCQAADLPYTHAVDKHISILLPSRVLAHIIYESARPPASLPSLRDGAMTAISAAFQTVLGRAADEAGLRYFEKTFPVPIRKELAKGMLDIQGVYQSLRGSDELKMQFEMLKRQREQFVRRQHVSTRLESPCESLCVCQEIVHRCVDDVRGLECAQSTLNLGAHQRCEKMRASFQCPC